MKLRGLALALVCAVLCGLSACGESKNPVPDVSSGGSELREGVVSPVGEAAGMPFERLEDILPAPDGAEDAKRLELFALTTVKNPSLPFNVACHIGDGEVTAVLPAGVELSALVPEFVLSGDRLLYQGQEAVSGETVFDFREPVELTLAARDGSETAVTVRVEALSTGLPSVALTTSDYAEIRSREEYQICSLYVGGGDGTHCPYAAEQTVLTSGAAKGRGNSSWGLPKSGYTVKLDEQVPLLDMPESRHWALVANYEDKSLIRNYLANYLAEQAGIAYVMQIRPVDFWYNGYYWGSYNLCEKVEVEKERVNITKFDPTLLPEENGYLLEFDGHVSEVSNRQKAGWEYFGSAIYDPVTGDSFLSVSIGNKWLTIKKPSYQNLREEDTYYIDERLSGAILALYGDDYAEVEAALDVESFVRWYLVEEFMNNADSSMHSSVYMTLDKGGQFRLGPVWDFDRSSGNCDYWNDRGNPGSLYASGAGWFHLLFEHEEARAVLLREWEAFSKKLETLDAEIGKYAAMLEVSQRLNFERWDILDKKIGANPDAVVRADTYAEQIELLQSYLADRREKLDSFLRRTCR